MISFTANIGHNVADTIGISGSVDADPTSVSGAYIRAFFAADADRSNQRFSWSASAPLPIDYELRYELAAGSPWRVELDVTAGASGYPVQALVADSGPVTTQSLAGLTNETLVATASPSS